MLRLSLLFFLWALPSSLYADCPVNYNTYKGHYCWRVIKGPVDYDFAEQNCNYYLGPNVSHVATVMDKGLNDLISQNPPLDVDTVYLGYRCNSTTQCYGNDGSVINAADYFYGGRANPAVGACVVMDVHGALKGKWISVDCKTISDGYTCGFDMTRIEVAEMQKSKCGVPYKLNVPVNITSMNYGYGPAVNPSRYDTNENCAYFIYGGPFTVYFDDFRTDDYDIVSIYSSAENYGPLTFVGKYSGFLNPFSVKITTKAALITFVTDEVTVKYAGFSARILPN